MTQDCTVREQCAYFNSLVKLLCKCKSHAQLEVAGEEAQSARDKQPLLSSLMTVLLTYHSAILRSSGVRRDSLIFKAFLNSSTASSWWSGDRKE